MLNTYLKHLKWSKSIVNNTILLVDIVGIVRITLKIIKSTLSLWSGHWWRLLHEGPLALIQVLLLLVMMLLILMTSTSAMPAGPTTSVVLFVFVSLILLLVLLHSIIN